MSSFLLSFRGAQVPYLETDGFITQWSTKNIFGQRTRRGGYDQIIKVPHGTDKGSLYDTIVAALLKYALPKGVTPDGALAPMTTFAAEVYRQMQFMEDFSWISSAVDDMTYAYTNIIGVNRHFIVVRLIRLGSTEDINAIDATQDRRCWIPDSQCKYDPNDTVFGSLLSILTSPVAVFGSVAISLSGGTGILEELPIRSFPTPQTK